MKQNCLRIGLTGIIRDCLQNDNLPSMSVNNVTDFTRIDFFSQKVIFCEKEKHGLSASPDNNTRSNEKCVRR